MNMVHLYQPILLRGCLPVAVLTGLTWLEPAGEPDLAISAAYAHAGRPHQSLDRRTPGPSAANTLEHPDGQYDCAVSNLTTGDGPYPLQCDKEGDEITIWLPDGDHLVVDERGYHAMLREHWAVRLDADSHHPW